MPPRKQYNAEGQKHCSKCGEWKDPLHDFCARYTTADGRHPYCKLCKSNEYYSDRERIRARQKEYEAKNKDRRKKISSKYQEKNRASIAKRKRERYLKDAYGMTLEEYDSLLTKQGGVCAICRKICKSRNHLSVDHCHETGANRGLLCIGCNTAIGLLREDPIIIDAALMYIVNHRIRIQENA